MSRNRRVFRAIWRAQAAAAAVAVAAAGAGCGGSALERRGEARSATMDPREARTIEEVGDELEAMNEPFVGATGHRETFRAILRSTLAKDAYICAPSPRALFFGSAPEGERVIRGVMPHYGFFFGPMSYSVRRIGARAGAAGRWEVAVRVALRAPPEGEELELPDCALASELGASVRCSGTPYAQSGAREACPASGSFRAPASARAVEALVRRWSREAEVYWNRDAAAVGIPVRYDFTFEVVGRAGEGAGEGEGAGAEAWRRPDMEVPLAPTCGRTPYFSSIRAGWSMPILAHEVGHVMGLLDEYEMFSGITSAYPKTPFPGAEVSRMGLSMFEETRALPLHHYLILRRYMCPEPEARDVYPRVL